jgi:hypothetical protein
MPDDLDFSVNDSDDVLDGVSPAFGDCVPDGDSGVLVKQATDPNLLKITRDGSSVTIGFNEAEIPDDLCIARYREQVFPLVAENEGCTKLIFDVKNLKFLPSGMLGLMASVMKTVSDVEIRNPSPDIRETLRIMKLDTFMRTSESDS